MPTTQIKRTDQTRTFHSQTPPHDHNSTLNYKRIGNYTYLSQHLIHTATTSLPVNILLLYKKHFPKVLISTLFFYKYSICIIFLSLIFSFVNLKCCQFTSLSFTVKNCMYPALLLLLLSLVSPLCRVFTIMYLKQFVFPGYIVLQLFYIYKFCYM